MQLSLSKKEKENRVIAGVSTAVICALLLLLLLFVSFKTVEKDEGSESGVMVQMGDPNEGGPDDSPQNQRMVPVSPQTPQAEENLFTSNQDEAVNVRQPNQTRPTPTTPTTTQPVPEQQRQIDQQAQEMMRAAANARQSRGQGGGENPGTQGAPDGSGSSPTGGSGGSGSSGTGNGFELGTGLGGRTISYAPVLKSRCENAKTGTVTFDVIVHANGEVTLESTTPSRGTTVTDECLKKEAIEALKKVRLNPLEPGSPSVKGIIKVKITN